MMARIIAVSDTLDAITTNRAYRSARDFEEALRIIRKAAGTEFDPEVVGALEGIMHSGKLRPTTALVPV